MSKAIKKEQIEATATIPMEYGGYTEARYKCFAWMCAGCGLVWDRRHLAQECEKRGHIDAFEKMYCSGTENGKPINPRYYPVVALRRDSIEPPERDPQDCTRCGETCPDSDLDDVGVCRRCLEIEAEERAQEALEESRMMDAVANIWVDTEQVNPE